MRFTLLLTLAVALLSACSGSGVPGSPPATLSDQSGPPALSANSQSLTRAGAPRAQQTGPDRVVVYTLSNGASRNKVLSFVPRGGALKYDQSFDTGGLGDPSVAGTVQGAIAIAGDNRFLFAVDAGSNEISSFRIGDDGLEFIDRIASGGMQPVSLAVHHDLLFVLNEGSSSIAGFRITRNGLLRRIPHLSAPLSGSGAGPAEISFDSSGTVLVVTEKATNNIDTYAVANGIPTGPTVHAASGMTPFGFAFVPRSEIVVVSDAFGGASGMGAASSYAVTPPNTLAPISALVPDDNTAPCWVVITHDGKLAFISNTGSDTISTYSIDAAGALTLASPKGVSAQTGRTPADLAISSDDRSLFVLSLKSRTIGAYSIGAGGRLTKARVAHGLPASALGLAAASPND
ncbi:MAG TPA: beta-propeller fold lactonase family protein [Candidatus Cybelea sp.]|jgi:6-phosphogluconolactonase (cycloisomerase 2 family)